jgi:hypothetical protein
LRIEREQNGYLFKKCVERVKFDIYVFKEEEVISMISNPRVLKCQQLSYLNDRTISPRREVWAQKPSLPLPLFIEMPMLNQESERSCICVLEVMYLCVRGHVFVC